MKPLRLGAGSRIDSHGVEKDSLPKIIFEDQNDTTQPSQSIELVDGELHVFDDPEGPNRTDLGTLPGGGGGGGGQVDSVGAGTAISVTGTLSDPVVNVVIADLISSDSPNTATTGSDSGLLVPPVDPASLISADTPNALSVGTDGGLVVTGGGNGTVRFTFTAAPATVEASISAPITIPYDWEITGWRMFDGTGGSGVATIDWLLLNNLGDTGVSITGSTTPYLSGSHAESSVLTGWTTTGTANQLLQAVLTGVTGFREITCELLLAKV